MGQTLTHGIYLPDKGERNCYSGLAANWQILDSSVGTIAAHTAALAGKAPLVHTHTKSQITDFPAYGATAGTICEGNDSRLSDARTPLSHTHAKANITDLLNSDFIPSANNSYNLGTSTNKWKSFNWINPGALSLPDTSRMAIIEIPSSWVWDGTTENSYTAPFTGWICIGSSVATNARLFNINSKIGMAQSSAVGTDMRAYIPMVAGDEIKISGITSSSFILRVYQCLGNV